jgi:uncharacterized membrane protein/mono/diheme cytochrome c family protein
LQLSILSLTELIGHFHPLLVHLPIGILLMGLLLQWLSRQQKFRGFQQAVPTILLCGIITSAASCITGYLLSISDDYDEKMVNWHMWMGILVLVVSCLLYLKERNGNFMVNKRVLSTALLVLVSVTGHLGGSLTHGSGYLTKPLRNIFLADSTINTTIAPLPNVQEALAYEQVVKPIFATKCMSCHNENKQKGGLRMDEPLWLMKGGKDGKVLEPGRGDASEMIKRLKLPVDNDKHMPPKEKPQPTESQINLLHWWINTGADFTRKVKDLDQPEKIKPLLTALQQATDTARKQPADLPQAPVEKADEKAVADLRAAGIVVIPLAQNNNYLEANFVIDSVVDKKDLEALKRLKKQLIWLRLENTSIGDDLAADLATLTALTRLNLSNTRITDRGLQQLSALKNLRYLNLTGTGVTAAGLRFLKPLTGLRNLYLYQTGVKSADYDHLKSVFPNTIIDTGGYRLESLQSDTTKVKEGKRE